MKRKLIPIFFFIATIPCAAQWKSIGYSPYQIYAFGVHDSILFLSAPDHIYRYDIGEADNGIGFGDGNVTWFASYGRYFYANQDEQSCCTNTYITSNEGLNWLESPNAAPIGSSENYLFGITIHPFTSEPPYIVLSRDSGQTWDSVSNCNMGNWAVRFASIGTCVFATTSTVLCRSKDTGTINSWSQLSPQFVGALMVMNSLLFMTANGNVIKSTDSGTQWITVPVDSGGTVPEHVNCLATDGKNLFAGTTNGVYVSTDIGKSWRAENEGLLQGGIFGSSLNVSAIGVFDSLLFVDMVEDFSQQFYSAYNRPIPEMTDTTPASVVQAITLGDTIAVYPNPLSNSAMITYSLAEQSRVTITIIDALGRAIAFPVSNESRTIGTYSLDFDASRLPSGVYWCRLSTGSETKIVTIIRS
jgi:Secretion system C-terminal sorting domain